MWPWKVTPRQQHQHNPTSRGRVAIGSCLINVTSTSLELYHNFLLYYKCHVKVFIFSFLCRQKNNVPWKWAIFFIMVHSSSLAMNIERHRLVSYTEKLYLKNYITYKKKSKCICGILTSYKASMEPCLLNIIKTNIYIIIMINSNIQFFYYGEIIYIVNTKSYNSAASYKVEISWFPYNFDTVH